jgi:hypothetical protein
VSREPQKENVYPSENSDLASLKNLMDNFIEFTEAADIFEVKSDQIEVPLASTQYFRKFLPHPETTKINIFELLAGIIFLSDSTIQVSL